MNCFLQASVGLLGPRLRGFSFSTRELPPRALQLPWWGLWLNPVLTWRAFGGKIKFFSPNVVMTSLQHGGGGHGRRAGLSAGDSGPGLSARDCLVNYRATCLKASKSLLLDVVSVFSVRVTSRPATQIGSAVVTFPGPWLCSHSWRLNTGARVQRDFSCGPSLTISSGVRVF